MKTAHEILTDIAEILQTKWATRNGSKVPEAESVTLGNDAVLIDGTVIYADLTDSTGLVDGFKNWFAAEVYKCYLVAASHLIRNNSGAITAFDGDRVMGVYIGETKNSSAAKTALNINWAVAEINAAIKKKYPNSSFQLKHTIGIDTSNLFVAKTGIRNSNDLIWVGRAANYAAKLCSLPGPISISEAVFTQLSETSRNGGNPKQCMWTKSHWPEKNLSIYSSDWTWKP